MFKGRSKKAQIKDFVDVVVYVLVGFFGLLILAFIFHTITEKNKQVSLDQLDKVEEKRVVVDYLNYVVDEDLKMIDLIVLAEKNEGLRDKLKEKSNEFLTNYDNPFSQKIFLHEIQVDFKGNGLFVEQYSNGNIYIKPQEGFKESYFGDTILNSLGQDIFVRFKLVSGEGVKFAK